MKKEYQLRFMNCTAHQLTDEQLKEIRSIVDEEELDLYVNVVNLKEHNNELFGKLVNCPADEAELEKLADNLIACFNGDEWVIHLPIGSPAFMFILSRKLLSHSNIHPVFSHSERAVVEEKQPDGSIKKISNFKFVKFQTKF